MADKQTVDTNEYAGLSSFAAAQGQSYVDGLKGSLYGAAAGLGVSGAAALVAPEKTVAFVKKMPIFGEMIKGKGGVLALATFGTAVVVSVVMSVTGFFSGSKKADAARAQFEALKSQRDIAQAKAEGLQTQVDGLHQEVTAHRKSFTELHAKREENSGHAANHASRAEHGSHADAALHDKEKVAASEHSV